MSILQALILGVLQGVTEFLPISSSGHLVVLPEMLNWQEHPLVFDTTLHLATSAAVIWYFWTDLKTIFLALLQNFISLKFDIKKYDQNGLMGVAILVGILPAGILGFLFDEQFETLFRGYLSVGIFMILGSLLMICAEYYYNSVHKSGNIGVKKGFGIGLFQSLALFPGVSRSGSTISGGMLLGLSRESAARFSFLLAVPIITMAGLFKLISSYSLLFESDPMPIVVGFLSAFLTGILAIKFLLGYVKNHSLNFFIIYRMVLGVLLLLLAIR